MNISRIIQGDALAVLKNLPSESVDMCITSPPYWALRDYGMDGQLGLEPDFHDYIRKLCDIFDEVYRVLKPEGACWVNLGDTYGGSNGAGFAPTKWKKLYEDGEPLRNKLRARKAVQSKSLLQIPNRFAIEMTERGWILRNEIIWHKPNVMPQSVRDRFTVDFEKVFFFTKQKKYFFDQQLELAVWDVDGTGTIKRALRQKDGLKSNPTAMRNGVRKVYPDGKHGATHQSAKFVNGLRNKRAVWKIATRPFKEAHFAVYPPELIETPIKSTCPEFVCTKCGRPQIRDIKRVSNYEKREEAFVPGNSATKVDSSGWNPPAFEDEGWIVCDCGAEFEPGVVLDPFFGAGTTGLVAQQLKRRYIGIELNPEYIAIAQRRLFIPFEMPKIYE